jgi:hypothetical protein
MAQNIQNYDISQTFKNVILSTVTGQPDVDGVPIAPVPNKRTGNLGPRNQGRLQDGAGSEIPLVLSTSVIESEATPVSAYSVTRRADIVGLHATQFINSLLWS